MNQVSRQNTKVDVEKDFFKLMVNPNYGHNCRNNVDNCYFSRIYDELEELMHAKRYQNIFNLSISKFVSTEYLERQIGEEFSKGKKNDAVISMRKSWQKKHKKIQ